VNISGQAVNGPFQVRIKTLTSELADIAAENEEWSLRGTEPRARRSFGGENATLSPAYPAIFCEGSPLLSKESVPALAAGRRHAGDGLLPRHDSLGKLAAPFGRSAGQPITATIVRKVE
jgi:hypothetical protein